jgi:hypothetical protein
VVRSRHRRRHLRRLVRARALDRETAVTGLDGLDEVQLHPIVAQTLIDAGFGVHRERRYPADLEKRKLSEGERCDLVLTENNRPLRAEAAASTLFDDPNAVDDEDAFWLEMKVVAQFTEEGPNRNYSPQLLSTVGRDVVKLSKDRGILHAGLLIVLFVQNEAIAEHDLGVWQDRCLQRGLPIAAPSRRTFPITDRLGNRLCVLDLYPVRHV